MLWFIAVCVCAWKETGWLALTTTFCGRLTRDRCRVFVDDQGTYLAVLHRSRGTNAWSRMGSCVDHWYVKWKHSLAFPNIVQWVQVMPICCLLFETHDGFDFESHFVRFFLSDLSEAGCCCNPLSRLQPSLAEDRSPIHSDSDSAGCWMLDLQHGRAHISEILCFIVFSLVDVDLQSLGVSIYWFVWFSPGSCSDPQSLAPASYRQYLYWPRLSRFRRLLSLWYGTCWTISMISWYLKGYGYFMRICDALM